MSDEINTEGTTVVVSPSKATDATAAPLPPPPTMPTVEHVRAEILGKLGVKSMAEAERALKAARDAEQARLTEAEKTAARMKELEAYEGKAKVYEETIKGLAATQLASLSEAQRQAVIEYAGEDPQAQLKALEFLRKTAPTAPPATATTTPAKPAPPTPSTGPTMYEKWRQMVNSNNPLSGMFYSQHQAAIDASAPRS